MSGSKTKHIFQNKFDLHDYFLIFKLNFTKLLF